MTEDRKQNVAAKGYLIFLGMLLLAAVAAGAWHLVFRQPVLRTAEITTVIWSFVVLFQAQKRIPAEKKNWRRASKAVLVLLAVLSSVLMLLQLFVFSDKESVVTADGEKKIKVENAFIMLYEVSYYEYGGPLWYRQYPCVRETYDDGNPDQLAYTEYYDEDGTLTERVYPGEG